MVSSGSKVTKPDNPPEDDVDQFLHNSASYGQLTSFAKRLHEGQDATAQGRCCGRVYQETGHEECAALRPRFGPLAPEQRRQDI